MQDLIKNMHSKRFLLIYLAAVAFLLMVYLSQQKGWVQTNDLPAVVSGPYNLSTPIVLPNFLLRDATQELYTNANLQGRWHFVYFYDGGCQPQCHVLWLVLGNLADRYAGQQLGFWVIDVSVEQPLLKSSTALPENVQVLYDPSGHETFWHFFVKAQDTDALSDSFLIMDPNGEWHAGFRAPFTSDALQRFYLKLRERFARNS